MGIQIEDGTGGASGLRINSENQMEVLAVAIPEDRHINTEHNGVWSLPFEGIDPAGADDYFLYITNTGTKNLAITDVRMSTTVTGTVEIRPVTGVPSYVSETAITPVNRFIGSSKAFFATANTDTDITELSSAGVLFYLELSTAAESFHLKTSSNIVIPPGQAVAMLWDQATGVLKGVISIVELQEP